MLLDINMIIKSNRYIKNFLNEFVEAIHLKNINMSSEIDDSGFFEKYK